MKFLLLPLFFCNIAFGQRLARDFVNNGDKTGSVSVLGYAGTDNKTYVLQGAPDGTFTIPIRGTFVQTPLKYTRNGADQLVSFDTTTPANNRPLPVNLVVGDSLGGLAFGSGASNAATLRMTLDSAQYGTLATDTLQTAGNTLLSSIDARLTTANTTLSATDAKTPALVSGRVPVDGSGVTQPVSASTLPLPTGASTAALQTSGNTLLSSIDTKTPALVSGKVPVDVGTLPLASGAATSALQTTGNTTLTSIDGKLPAQVSGRVPVDGSGVTQPVNILNANLFSGTIVASQKLINTSGTADALNTTSLILGWDGVRHRQIAVDTNGYVLTSPAPETSSVGSTARLVYSTTNVTTGAWVQLIASLVGNSKKFYIFDSSGQTLEFGTGASGSETRRFIIPPGGIEIPLSVGAGTRISIRAISGTASSGEIIVNTGT